MHDLLLSKRGVALPPTHGLHAAVTRYKARLVAELSRARIRRGFSSVEALRADVGNLGSAVDHDGQSPVSAPKHPRWIRINTLLTTVEEQLSTTFAGFEKVSSIDAILRPKPPVVTKLVYFDHTIPDLVCVPSSQDLANTKAYKQGKIVFQDKASCFPAYLLDPQAAQGDVIDACAAPGNKTTHLAAILQAQLGDDAPNQCRIIACERDVSRSQVLTKMVHLAGADILVRVKSRQDFLKLDPNSKETTNVTALLLDPSCSGSGIVGRDQGGVTVHLPVVTTDDKTASPGRGRKRKRRAQGTGETSHPTQISLVAAEEESAPDDTVTEDLESRLIALSKFQLRLLQHAMTFPAATRITYSTCSIHAEENESVVLHALCSDVAQRRGWRILTRESQVEGLKKWSGRGDLGAVRTLLKGLNDNVITQNADDIADACIRCDKHAEDGTMGFFVAGFVRPHFNSGSAVLDKGKLDAASPKGVDDDEEWDGFEDQAA